jgi:butyryl-CoA dehydrogenase
MGIHGSATYELIFNDCIVPKENLLGELGQGFKIAMNTLNGGRIGIAAQALGIAQGAIDQCIGYVKTHSESTCSEKPLSSLQNTQFELADMQTKLDAARLSVYRAAQAKHDGDPYAHLAAMGKLFASEVAMDTTTRCMQLVGDYGYTETLPFARFLRDAKITEIYEGTSEVQKMVIASWMGLK